MGNLTGLKDKLKATAFFGIDLLGSAEIWVMMAMALKCGAGFSPTNSAAVLQLPSLKFCKDYCKFARGRIRVETHHNAAIRAAQDVIQRDSGSLRHLSL